MTDTGDAGTSRVQRLRRRMVDQLDERSLASAGSQSERSVGAWWRYRGAGSVAAVPVHLVTVAFAVVGVLVWFTTEGWPWKVVAVVCVLVALATRPSLPRYRPDGPALTREDAPQLFSLLDDAAAQLGGPVPDRVHLTEELNAAAGRDGRRRVMMIGAPLWFALTHQGRIALLAHELGHFAHGDLTDGFLVGGAQETLEKWHEIGSGAVSTEAWQDEEGYADQRFSHLVTAPLRGVTSGYLGLLTVLNGPMARRREHLADREGVRLAGSRGALDAMDALVSADRIQAAMQRAVLGRERRDVWEAVQEQMRDLSPDTRAREREQADVRPSRIDDDHPANHLRIRLVQSQPWTEPAVWRDAAGWAAIDAEVARVLPEVTRAAQDSFRGT